MTFIYNNKEYEVEIIKKNNKNTYIRIKNNRIYVTTSYFTSKFYIEKLLEKNKTSIGKMIDKSLKKENNKKEFKILGIPHQIIVNKESKFSINGNIITSPNEKKIEDYLRNIAKNIYQERLLYYYKLFDEDIPKPTLKIRKMTSRWGVCNTKTHQITLNLELIHYDIECLNYVIVHELSHLLEGNHSRLFWNIVEKYYPNYKSIRKKLRDSC